MKPQGDFDKIMRIYGEASRFRSVGQIEEGCWILSQWVLCAPEALCERKWWWAEGHLLCHLARLLLPGSFQVGTGETPSSVVWTRCTQDKNLLSIHTFHTTYISRCEEGFIYLTACSFTFCNGVVAVWRRIKKISQKLVTFLKFKKTFLLVPEWITACGSLFRIH